jgi:hypothetical protein
MKADRQTFTIAGLAAAAVALVAAHLSITAPAVQAGEVVLGRKYSLASARVLDGGEGIYVFDNDKELVALFIWDASEKRFTPRDVRQIGSLFGGEPR